MLTRIAELFLWALSTAAVMLFAWIVIVLSLFIVYPLALIWQSSPVLELVLIVLGGTVGGAVVGVVQKSVFQIKARCTKAWFWASVVSWGFAAPAWWIEYQIFGGTKLEIRPQDVVPAILATGVVSGIILGTIQWIIMSWYVKISFLWVLSTSASWLLGAVVMAFIVPIFDLGIFTYLVSLLALGAIVGLGTGLAQRKLINS